MKILKVYFCVRVDRHHYLRPFISRLLDSAILHQFIHFDLNVVYISDLEISFAINICMPVFHRFTKISSI